MRKVLGKMKRRGSRPASSLRAVKAVEAGQPLPEELVEEVLNGNVVCFIGSGFSRASGLPDWMSLLRGIANDMVKEGALSREDAAVIERLGSSNSSHDLDMAAQILSDVLDGEAFDRRVREKLTVRDRSNLPQAMKDRLKWVHGIPFSAILTTNFDNLLSGIDAQHPRFGSVAVDILRESKTEFQRMQDAAFSNEGVPVVKIHGDVERPGSRLVLTRERFRKMLHESTQYSTFLRTLLATKTVLFVGFSFTDSYLNELRSEVMALFGSPPRALAYAILPDVSPVQERAMRSQEGLQVLNFDSKGGKDFSGVDSYLRALFNLTNPVIKFGRLLHERSVLWLHQSWETSRSTKFLKEYLERANVEAKGKPTTRMHVVGSANEALELVRDPDLPLDCIICCFDGNSAADQSQEGEDTLRLLSSMAEEPNLGSVPTLVFGYDVGPAMSRARSSEVIRLGARCYTSIYYELLSELAYVLENTEGSSS